jgi:hypothetical protein
LTERIPFLYLIVQILKYTFWTKVENIEIVAPKSDLITYKKNNIKMVVSLDRVIKSTFSSFRLFRLLRQYLDFSHIGHTLNSR